MAMTMACSLSRTWLWQCYDHGRVITKANVMAKAMILEKVKARALYLGTEMTLVRVKGSG